MQQWWGLHRFAAGELTCIWLSDHRAGIRGTGAILHNIQMHYDKNSLGNICASGRCLGNSIQAGNTQHALQPNYRKAKTTDSQDRGDSVTMDTSCYLVGLRFKSLARLHHLKTGQMVRSAWIMDWYWLLSRSFSLNVTQKVVSSETLQLKSFLLLLTTWKGIRHVWHITKYEVVSAMSVFFFFYINLKWISNQRGQCRVARSVCILQNAF